MSTKLKIQAGVNKLANPVKQTLGTKGRTVMFLDDNGKPHITKDGVTVARHIRSEDNFENMVIAVLREASIKTMLSSGDGSSTTLVLAQYLVNNGMQLMDEGMSYYELSKQIDKALADVINYIQSKSIDITTTPELLREIASISANDEKVGDFIYSIIQEIGLFGDVEVKPSQYSETRVDKTKGMKLHKGWYEAFMVNNIKDMTFEMSDCHILLFNDVIQSVNDFLPYLNSLKGKPLVVFCDDISDITLSQIKTMMQATKYPVCFVENDGFGDRKMILLNDLAALTSAYIITSGDEFNEENLGFAGRVRVTELYTSILDGDMDEELINSIVEEIKEKLDSNVEADDLELSNREKKFYQKRLANLTGGVAVIYAGGRTEMEMKELKDRLDDAVLAVSSAIKQGINVGGGHTYINCKSSLGDKGRAYNLVTNALEAPFKQLLINADLIDKEDYFKSLLLKGKAIDLRTNEIHTIKKGTYKVYDPTSVLIDSVSNAVAVSKSLLSVKTMIYEAESTN
jgi:chaperonin GroEL